MLIFDCLREQLFNILIEQSSLPTALVDDIARQTLQLPHIYMKFERLSFIEEKNAIIQRHTFRLADMQKRNTSQQLIEEEEMLLRQAKEMVMPSFEDYLSYANAQTVIQNMEKDIGKEASLEAIMEWIRKKKGELLFLMTVEQGEKMWQMMAVEIADLLSVFIEEEVFARHLSMRDATRLEAQRLLSMQHGDPLDDHLKNPEQVIEEAIKTKIRKTIPVQSRRWILEEMVKQTFERKLKELCTLKEGQ